MSEDIALDIYGSTSSSASSSTETLFDARRPLLNRGRVHPGYGASKLPLRPSAAGGFAGSEYSKIFEGQLGAAAADPENPLGKVFDKVFYPNRLTKEQEQEFSRIILDSGFLSRDQLKPADLKWNSETRKQYPEHWEKVRELKRKQALALPGVQPLRQSNHQDQIPKVTPLGKEWILPFSNNIGPGNPVRPAKNTADLIAQGHDLHYQDAKKDSHVLSADREAISQFAHEAVQGQDPISRIHAAVGGIGLGLKNTVETALGKVIYG